MSHRTRNLCTHSLLFWFLTQWRSSWHYNPLNCPSRWEILIAAPGCHASLKAEKKHNAFFSHLSRTRSGANMSLPGWSMERHISPTISTSIQQFSKSRTWSYRLSSTKPGESERLWDTPALLRSSPFVETEKQLFKSFENTNIRIYILKMWLNVDLRKKVLNLRCATHNFQSWTPSRNTYTSFSIYKGLLSGGIQLPRQMPVKNRKLGPIFVGYIPIIALHCWER